jgi:hypothetical protein
MAILKSTATGNFSSSGTWSVVSADGYNILSNTTIANTTTSYTYSQTYTNNTLVTAQGVFLYINAVNTATGTFTVGIFTAAGTTPLASVTVNVSDLSSKTATPVFFKFTSTTALSAATTYRVGVLSSTNATVSLGRTAATTTDWVKAICTTTAGTPAATDTIFVSGDLTGAGTSASYVVTMNNTSSATSYGGVYMTPLGTMNYGTTGGVNYYLKLAGVIRVYNGGTFTIGTLATPIPSNSTAKLEFACTVVNQFGITVFDGGTFTTYGATKTESAKLAANVAATATTATTNISTGWLSGDQLVIPPTNRVSTQFDTPTLNGAASGVNLTFSAGLSFAHETTPSTTTACDIINLTRNVQIFGQGSGFLGTLSTYIYINGGTVSLNYTQIYYLGNTTTLTTSGLVSNITSTNTSSVIINGCSIYGPTAFANYILYNNSTQATSTFSCTNTVSYGGYITIGSNNAVLTPSTVTYDSCVFLRSPVLFNRIYVTATNITAAGSPTMGFGFNDLASNTVGAGTFGTVNNLITYCNTNQGFYFANPGGTTNTYASGTISNLTAWRNTNQGFYHLGSAPQPLYISGLTLVGNTNNNIQLLGSGQIYIKNLTSNSQTTYTTAYSIVMGASDKVYIVDSSLGGTAAETIGAILAGSNGAVYPVNLSFYNTTFGAYSSIVVSQTQLPGRSTSFGLSSMKHNGVANSTFNWQQFGTVTTDSTIYNSSAYSMRMTPASTVFKTVSHPFRMAISANDTVTLSVNVRKSVVGDGTAYNGNQPRILLAPTPLLGYGLNTVLTTATGASGSWETITTTFTPTASGVYEFFLDCDGSTGWVNVDDWLTDYVKDTTKMDYWFLGMPDVNITGIPKERSNTFVY